jgi:hypothetical protein
MRWSWDAVFMRGVLKFGCGMECMSACMHKRRHAFKMRRVGQNRMNAPYMVVYLVISMPKTPYIHRIYMVLANPKNAVYMRAVALWVRARVVVHELLCTSYCAPVDIPCRSCPVHLWYSWNVYLDVTC